MADYTLATAKQPFSCRSCNAGVSAGTSFYWDNTGCAYGQKGQRLCQLCYNKRTAGNGGSAPAQAAPDILARLQELELTVSVLKSHTPKDWWT